MGVGFIASRAQQLDRDGVAYRPLRGPRPYLSLGAAYHPDNDSRVVRVFLDQAKRAGARLAG
jgi:DNA-binding transcriptional LysR family regulator